MQASLRQEGPNYVLLVERRLDYPPEKVWRALTEADQLAQWFPARVDGEWTVGAALRFTFRPDEADYVTEEDLRGQVIAVDHPRLLEFRWGTHLMRFELDPDGEGCVFRLSESFDDPSLGAQNAAGWEMCLENLDLILEGVGALKFIASVWRTKYQAYVAKFESDFGPQNDPTGDHPLLKEGGEEAGR